MNKLNSNFFNINQDSSLKSFIQVYENALPNDICDLVVEEYSKCNLWKPTLDSGKTRSCLSIPISVESVWQNANYEHRKSIDEKLFFFIQQIVNLYSNKHEFFIAKKDSGYDLLKYSKGQYCAEHIDSSYVQDPRNLSCSIVLNDNYDGGEFCFFKRKLKYKLSKGSALVFPSNYMYPHEVLSVTKGIRYSIITWFF